MTKRRSNGWNPGSVQPRGYWSSWMSITKRGYGKLGLEHSTSRDGCLMIVLGSLPKRIILARMGPHVSEETAPGSKVYALTQHGAFWIALE